MAEREHGRICKGCQWWLNAEGDNSQFRLCAWHNGLKAAEARKVDFGGYRPLRTTAEFGCVDWTKNPMDIDTE